MQSLREILSHYLERVPWLKEYCDMVLRGERWGGNAVLIVVDASLVSSGLSYFGVVLPKVEEFRSRFVESGAVRTLRDLAEMDADSLASFWRNGRTVVAMKEIAGKLSQMGGGSDAESLRRWASSSSVSAWRKDAIGSIKGIGIITFQYLRNMGGADTIVPDRIVKKFLNEALAKAGLEPINGTNEEFVERAEAVIKKAGFRPTEITWLSWIIQSGADKFESYRYLLR